jgi:hypothetical protein
VAELEEDAQLYLHGVARGDVHCRKLSGKFARERLQVLRNALIQRLEHAAWRVDVQVHLQKEGGCGVKEEIQALTVQTDRAEASFDAASNQQKEVGQ